MDEMSKTIKQLVLGSCAAHQAVAGGCILVVLLYTVSESHAMLQKGKEERKKGPKATFQQDRMIYRSFFFLWNTMEV